MMTSLQLNERPLSIVIMLNATNDGIRLNVEPNMYPLIVRPFNRALRKDTGVKGFRNLLLCRS